MKRRGPVKPGMVDRDDGAPRGAARDAPADFMAAFGGNDNRYPVADGAPASETGGEERCLYGGRGGVPIGQRDVLRMGGRGCGDGLGSAGLVKVPEWSTTLRL